MNLMRVVIATLLVAGCCVSALSTGQEIVEVKSLPQQHRVEVLIEGKPFTAYRYGPGFQQKPVFYPVVSPSGVVVNRDLPRNDQSLQKKQDHPHHQSLFFGYGDVDGVDFWTCSQGERLEHRAVMDVSGGSTGKLSVLIDWLNPEGQVLLHEVKRVTFGTASDVNWMDHDITLTAVDKPRSFDDTKEGMFAIRVADELREDEGTGRYINAYGWETADQIWGKRSPWVALQGSVEGKDVTIAIFDHPTSENHPSYWHARGYGLFSINPFGRKDFVEGGTPDDRVLAPLESFHFKHRVLVYDGIVSKERLDQDYWEYVK